LFRCDAETLVAKDFYNIKHAISDKIIKSLDSPPKIIRLKPESVLKYVCDKIGVNIDVARNTRIGIGIRAKMIAAVIISEQNEITLDEIAALLNLRNHATILHYFRSISNDRLRFNPILRNDWDNIVNSLNMNKIYYYKAGSGGSRRGVTAVYIYSGEKKKYKTVKSAAMSIGVSESYVGMCAKKGLATNNGYALCFS
jgi:hypothetical protein